MTTPIDTLAMREAALNMPEQIQAVLDGIDVIGGLPDPERIEHVLILGMGDSGFGGDVAAASARPFSSLPIVVYGGYLPPSWVGPSSLVIAISASGTTEETLESLEAAVEAGASLVAVTAGGELEDLTRRAHGPVLPVIGAGPMPRASLGALAVPPMLALEQLGLFPGARVWLAEAVEQLKIRRDQLMASDSQATQIAEALGTSIPLIYGGGAIGTTAARRWKMAVNHNVKSPAFWAAMPELCHNELVGWSEQIPGQAELFSQVHLRHEWEHPQTARRFEYVDERTRSVMNDILTVQAEGDGPIAQLFDLIMMGDLVTLEMAAARGIDPGPLAVIEDLKDWLE